MNDDEFGQTLVMIDDVVIRVAMVDEYRPGLWQVRTEAGTEFVISGHVLREAP